MKNDCEGCNMYDEEHNACLTDLEYYPDLLERCPCRICVVKVVCNNVCEDYQEVVVMGMYRGNFRRSPNEL